MILDNISFIGWIHAIACLLAMASGTVQMFARKGTTAHAARGNVYFFSMIVANSLALFIYELDVAFGPDGAVFGPVFGVFHWLAVLTLAVVLLARFAASRQQHAFFAYAHPVCMIISYWFLMGGAISQAFERVAPVRAAAFAVSPDARNIGDFKLHLWFQIGFELVIAAGLVAAIVQVRRHRRRNAAAPPRKLSADAQPG